MTANVHRRTPSLSVSDCRGLPIRQIAYLRSVVGEAATALVTRQQHDAAGRLAEQWDPRLSRPNIVTVYSLSGEPLKVDSVDAGWRLSLPGLAGKALERWDARGSHSRTTYDDQIRVVALEENTQPDVDTFTYADASADAGHNLRGQLVEQIDPSGTLHLHSYGLLGQSLGETRTFHDAKAFSSRRTYSPLGAVLEQIDAGEHRQQSRYDLAGQLKQAQLQLKGQTAWQPVLQDARYNAAGQIIVQQAGNGVTSHWHYDPADARLQRQQVLNGQAPLQDFEYEYDPMGNIVRIVDHVFTPTHFANQRVDGHRDFSYDSLYRLTAASGYDDGPPSDIPGRPQPSDPNDRRNYTQTYDYDHGGNLIRLRHVRDGASHTREMFIDPVSNRGARWSENDPVPDFDTLFDAHGNLLALQPGQPMQWNARDQLASVTLLKRDSGPDDNEHYRYSQGVRVYKRHDTYASTINHFHEVRYLPGLEVRTRDNGEELHVITLAAGFGSARCLHWVTGKPADIDADQLRYTLDDHLGSCLMELDQQARLISHEGYYPFGATAWLMAPSLIEVEYKTVRHSGKEMDISGLYYYGARYYAPWLQRWISADPAGNVDGLNLFAFVGNNPLRFVDSAGTSKEEWQVMHYSTFISELGTEAATALAQIDNVINKTHIGKELLKNLAGESVAAAVGFAGGYGAGEIFSPLAPAINSIPYAGGFISGNIGGDVAVAFSDSVTPTARWIRPLIPQTSAMSVAAIDRRLGLTQDDSGTFSVQDSVGFFLGRVVGSVVPAINVALGMGARVQEAEDIKNGLDPVKINKIDMMLVEWKSALDDRWARTEAAYKALGKAAVNPANLMPNVNNMTPKEDLELIHQADLRQQTVIIRDLIDRAQKGMAWYKEMSTTDNQFLLKQGRSAAKTSRN